MELMTAITNRRSIRKFQNEPISEEQIKALLDAACLSPSAKNRQNWRFMVLRHEEKDTVAQLMEDWCTEMGENIPRYAKSSRYSAGSIRQASVLILIFREKDDLWDAGDLLSIGSAVEHICLRAEEMGLGTLWILDTRYAADQICEYVGSGDLLLTCSVAVGIADEAPQARPRMAAEERTIPFGGR